MRIVESQSVADIQPLLAEWLKVCRPAEFNLDVTVEGVMADLAARLEVQDGAILLAMDGVEPVGFFSLFAVKSTLSGQGIAVETFWFSLPNRNAGPRLFRAAQKWAKDHGCTHVMTSASRLASDMHDKVCAFYERMGMKSFETTYIGEV